MNNQEYFQSLQQGLDEAMAIAQEARSQGLDPTTEVEIPLAVDLAERVEKLIGIPGIAARIREHDAEGMSREEAALAIGIDFAEGRLGGEPARSSRWRTPSAPLWPCSPRASSPPPWRGSPGWSWERMMMGRSTSRSIMPGR